MDSPRVARTWLAVALLVGACGAFNLTFLARVLTSAPPAGAVDRVTRAERRFDAVRGELPRTGRVGYVLSARDPKMLDWYKDYGLYFAQYALAPLVVEADAGHELVLDDGDAGVRLIRRGAR